MPCTEPRQACIPIKKTNPALMNTDSSATKYIAIALLSLLVASQLSGCKSRPLPPSGGVISPPSYPSAPAPSTAPPPAVAAPALPRAANWAEYRRRAAQMILASNPGASFTGAVPEQWQGIATVSVTVNADGSIRQVELLRSSRVAPHVNEMALTAVRRVGNFGAASHLPQPWQFNETFLYNDDNKFQLVTIVENR